MEHGAAAINSAAAGGGLTEAVEGAEHREHPKLTAHSCEDEDAGEQQAVQAPHTASSSAAPAYRTAAEGSHCFECAYFLLLTEFASAVSTVNFMEW